MKIKQVEKQTGMTAQSIRFYEREGLILPKRDPDNHYRTYNNEDVERLKTIAFCRRLGIPVASIRRLLAEQVSFRDCVEEALMDARAAEQEARNMAELCQSVLTQLDAAPDLTAQECTQVLLGAPHVRYLYEQVIPWEQRKPRRQFSHYHVFYFIGAFVVILGLLCGGMIWQVASIRSARADFYAWFADPQNALTLVYEDREYPVKPYTELDRMVGNLVSLGKPTEFLPGLRSGTDSLVLRIDGPQGRGELLLYLQDDSVGMIWSSPNDQCRMTLVRHQAWVQLNNILRLLKQE